ncbi:MAG: tannase/feruloyl esterase family alpha/beta hydrolase, partial [Planctomycetota bacterium]
TSPDLSSFRKRGGKLIIYSGWSDAAAPGLAMVGYYEDVLSHDKTAADDARLFMMPGVEHCFGGPGPSWVNFLTEIDKWVDSGKIGLMRKCNPMAQDQFALIPKSPGMMAKGIPVTCRVSGASTANRGQAVERVALGR